MHTGLNGAQTQEIRRLYAEGWSARKLAEKYGVAKGTILARVSDLAEGRATGAGKLSPEQVVEIRERYAAGETTATLQEAFGLGSPMTVNNIVRGKVYKHLPGPITLDGAARKRKLTCSQVEDVRRRYADGESARTLSDELGMDRRYISSVARGHDRKGERITAENLALEGEVWAVSKCGVQVSSVGRVFGKHGITRGHIRNGYLRYGRRGIHRLVCQTFNGDPPTEDHTHVAHIDGNRMNNRSDNLRWATPLENSNDQRLLGRTSRRLTWVDVKLIKSYLALGYKGVAVAKMFNVGAMSVSNIKHRKTWQHIRECERLTAALARKATV